MNTVSTPYPIGTPGTPWGDAERAEWLSRQTRQRSYEAEVLSVIEGLRSRFDVEEYGALDYGPDYYPLMAIRSRDWNNDLPVVLITGGVHGYETSGVHGALQFLDKHAEDYAGRVNLLVAPCVSPWAYERIHRWNYNAIDPNRSFHEGSRAEESAALMRLVAPVRDTAAPQRHNAPPATVSSPQIVGKAAGASSHKGHAKVSTESVVTSHFPSLQTPSPAPKKADTLEVTL